MRISPSSSDAPEGLRDDVRRSVAEALEASQGDWHRCESDGCEVDGEAAARIAADAALARMPGPGSETRSLLARIRELRRRVERLQLLAETIRLATVWDYSVYDQAPDEEWLAIDRDDYGQVLDALASVDSWQPWNRPLERRLGDV